MKTKSSIAVASFFGLALTSLGCSGDPKHPDSPASLATDTLETLTTEQLASRLYEVTREPRFREKLLSSVAEIPGQSPAVRDRLAEVTEEVSVRVTSDYLTFYDRPTLLAAVRFFESEAGRTYVLREPALDRQIARKERLWERDLHGRAAAAGAAEPIIDAPGDTTREEAPTAGDETNGEPSPMDDSTPVPGTPGEIARAKKTCKKPALNPLPPAEPAKLLERLTGRWYACSGKFDVVGQEGPQAAAGLEVTANGRWYLLDASANGALVRRRARDMRDQFSGRVGPENENLLFMFDSPTNGPGGFMAQLVFASTVPAMDFDQTRMVRVDPQ